VRLPEFRDEVRREFGDRLERATPANVRNFLTRMQARLTAGPAPGERIELNETATSYEEVITDFLSRSLEGAAEDPERALIALWLLALELHFARVADDYAERFARAVTDLDVDIDAT
jgi:hypothetical protein